MRGARIREERRGLRQKLVVLEIYQLSIGHKPMETWEGVKDKYDIVHPLDSRRLCWNFKTIYEVYEAESE
jgi:hypothetical protein